MTVIVLRLFSNADVFVSLLLSAFGPWLLACVTEAISQRQLQILTPQQILSFSVSFNSL